MSNIDRRTFLQLSAGLAAAAAAPHALAAGKEKIVIYSAPALPTVTIAVAALQGKLGKQTDLSVQTWRSPDQLRAGVANGQFKVMMSPSNVGVMLRNQGQKVGMVNILTTGIIQLLSKNKPIAAPRDLAGKKIIVPFKNDMPDIVLQALLKKSGVDIGRVNITYAATPVEAVGLFLTKDYDAILAPEPTAAATILRGKTMGVNVVRGFDLTKTWGEVFNTKPMIPQAGMIADVDFYNSRKAQFDLFHQDLKTALSWIHANPQSAAQIGKNYLPAPVPAIVGSIPHANLTVVRGTEIKADLMRFYEELMRFNPKLLGGKLPDSGFFL